MNCLSLDSVAEVIKIGPTLPTRELFLQKTKVHIRIFSTAVWGSGNFGKSGKVGLWLVLSKLFCSI